MHGLSTLWSFQLNVLINVFLRVNDFRVLAWNKPLVQIVSIAFWISRSKVLVSYIIFILSSNEDLQCAQVQKHSINSINVLAPPFIPNSGTTGKLRNSSFVVAFVSASLSHFKNVVCWPSINRSIKISIGCRFWTLKLGSTLII